MELKKAKDIRCMINSFFGKRKPVFCFVKTVMNAFYEFYEQLNDPSFLLSDQINFSKNLKKTHVSLEKIKQITSPYNLFCSKQVN